jgi:hypothetical protein
VNRNPPETNGHQPQDLNPPLPAFGWWMRHVRGITFTNCDVRLDANDDRPAIVVNDGQNITFNGFVFATGAASGFDFGFTNVNGFHIGADTLSTAGRAPRVNSVGSNPN